MLLVSPRKQKRNQSTRIPESTRRSTLMTTFRHHILQMSISIWVKMYISPPENKVEFAKLLLHTLLEHGLLFLLSRD